MGFFDDLSSVLDDLFKTPSEGENPYDFSQPIGQVGINLTGIEPESLEAPTPPKNFQTQSYENQKAINQSRQLGLNSIDVNPSQCDALSFPILVNIQQIWDKTGFQNENVFQSFNPALNNTVNAWRSIKIPLSGDFLKIEFGSSLLNIAPTSGSPNYDAQLYKKRSSSTFSNPQFGQSPQQFGFEGLQGNKFIFVQFNDNSSPLLYAKHGTIFKTEFASVTIHFQYFISRFSIIVGNKSEIIEDTTNKLMSAMPAYGPGEGLWNNPKAHCVPFWWNHNQGNDPRNRNQSVQLTRNQSVSQTFLSPEAMINAVGGPFGYAIGWVTEINVSFTLMTNANIDAVSFELQKVDNLGNLIKVYDVLATTINTSPTSVTLRSAPKEPIRFTLASIEPDHFSPAATYFEVLRGNLANLDSLGAGTAGTVHCWLSVKGYVYGSLLTFQVDANSQRYNPEYLINNPFPQDSLITPINW